MKQSDIYNEFSKEGTLTQVEYALHSVKKYLPICCVSQKNHIILAGKKPNLEKLQIRTDKLYHEIQNGLYCSTTGNPADIQHIISKIAKMSYEISKLLSNSPKPDVLAKRVGEKLQKNIQETGERVCAFSALIFGFDNEKSILYNVDSSASCLPYFAVGIGRSADRMNKHLEKKYNDQMSIEESIQLCLEALTKPLNGDYFTKDFELFVFKKNDNDVEIVELKENELASYLSLIQEND